MIVMKIEIGELYEPLDVVKPQLFNNELISKEKSLNLITDSKTGRRMHING